MFLASHLSVPVQVHFQWLHVVLKPERAHRPQQVVPVNRLPLLPLALVASPKLTTQRAVMTTKRMSECQRKQTGTALLYITQASENLMKCHQTSWKRPISRQPKLASRQAEGSAWNESGMFYLGAVVLSRSGPNLLACDETDELRDALLHRLLGILCNLGVRGKCLLHDATDVGNRQKSVLLADVPSLSPARSFDLVLVALRAPWLVSHGSNFVTPAQRRRWMPAVPLTASRPGASLCTQHKLLEQRAAATDET